MLGIGSEADPGADFSKGWRSFVDMDVDVGVLEQADGGTETTDAAADDREAERVGGVGRSGDVIQV